MPEKSGDIIKLEHQFVRAQRLADWIIKESSLSEFKDAVRLRPKTDYWTQIALVLEMTRPSEVTQTLALLILEDRQRQLEKAKETLNKFHVMFPSVKTLKSPKVVDVKYIEGPKRKRPGKKK